MVCGVTAAGAHYLVQGLAGGTAGRASFIIAVLVLPALLQLTASGVRILVKHVQRARGSRQD
jgi:hypothetical protein